MSLKEAEETVARWYSDRPEVLEWQAEQKRLAAQRGWVDTLLGRRRNLKPLGIMSRDRFTKARAERAAINTPIQGSAADIAAAAMVAIDVDEWLKAHGWKLLLQVRMKATWLHNVSVLCVGFDMVALISCPHSSWCYYGCCYQRQQAALVGSMLPA